MVESNGLRRVLAALDLDTDPVTRLDLILRQLLIVDRCAHTVSTDLTGAHNEATSLVSSPRVIPNDIGPMVLLAPRERVTSLDTDNDPPTVAQALLNNVAAHLPSQHSLLGVE